MSGITRFASLLALLSTGCLPRLGPPGSPTGGDFCLVEPGRPDECYPKRTELLAAQRRRRNEEQKRGDLEPAQAHQRSDSSNTGGSGEHW